MVGWWIGNAIGIVVVLPLVLVLMSQVARPVRQIAWYADDILEHGVGLSGNLDPVPELVRTRELVGEVTQHAVEYVGALEQLAGARG
jgi:hypothetical protein